MSRLVLGAALVLALVAAGCGGKKPLTTAEYSAQLSKICSTLKDEETAIGTISSFAELAINGPQFVTSLDGIVKEIKRLKPPTALAGSAARFLALYEERADLFGRAVSSAQKHDTATAGKLASQVVSLTKQADALGKSQLGAPACATV